MPTVSEIFALGKSQSQLDFVDVNVEEDTPLFIDPFALSRRRDRWSMEANRTLTEFFQRVVTSIRNGKDAEAMELLANLREPNETRLGLSSGSPHGAGIGDFQAEALFNALKSSSAVQTGLIQALEECELMIDGIGWDKISDLTTNVIRGHLVEYTQAQCALHGIPVQELPLAPCYDHTSGEWIEDYHELPIADGKALVLVPKKIARYQGSCQAGRYYELYVLNFLQAQAINAGSNLVRTLKNGKKVVTKKDLKQIFPYSKKFLFEFSKDHPDVLHRYRQELVSIERQGINSTVGDEDQATLAAALRLTLNAVPGGNPDSTRYQLLMLGILELLFYPSLTCPKKEHEINSGRKRIDIVFNNDAESGVFRFIQASLRLPCPYIVFECKNYTREVANHELDQLLGRFSPNRGEVGFVCCRTFDNYDLFLERCRDSYRDRRGLVIPFEDAFVHDLLELLVQGKRSEVDTVVQARLDTICSV